MPLKFNYYYFKKLWDYPEGVPLTPGPEAVSISTHQAE